MNDLIKLLSDGHARTEKLLAIELHTTVEDVKRQIEYLENMGIIRRVNYSSCGSGCSDGGGCGGNCSKCAPKGGFQNMGVMYEVTPATQKRLNLTL